MMSELGMVQAFLRGQITGVQRLDDGPVLYHHFLERPYEPVTIKLRPYTVTGEPIENHCSRIKRVALLDKNQSEVHTESSADVMRVPQSLFEKVYDKGPMNVIARFDHNKEKQDLVVKLGGDCFFIRVDVESPLFGAASYTTPKIFFRTKYGPARKRSNSEMTSSKNGEKRMRQTPQEMRLEKTLQPYFENLKQYFHDRISRLEARMEDLVQRYSPQEAAGGHYDQPKYHDDVGKYDHNDDQPKFGHESHQHKYAEMPSVALQMQVPSAYQVPHMPHVQVGGPHGHHGVGVDHHLASPMPDFHVVHVMSPHHLSETSMTG